VGGRCEAAGPEKPEVCSLEYITCWFWTVNNADGRGSFAAVEGSVSDRPLPLQCGLDCVEEGLHFKGFL